LLPSLAGLAGSAPAADFVAVEFISPAAVFMEVEFV
jgi:hypothetical protein